MASRPAPILRDWKRGVALQPTEQVTKQTVGDQSFAPFLWLASAREVVQIAGRFTRDVFLASDQRITVAIAAASAEPITTASRLRRKVSALNTTNPATSKIAETTSRAVAFPQAVKR